MKKIIIVLLLSLVACICSAEEIALFEGFDNFSWGITQEKIKSKYPGARSLTLPKQKEIGETVLSISGNGPTKVFYFFNNKLYKGRITIFDVKADSIDVIFLILGNTYGEPYGGHPIETFDGIIKSNGYSCFWAPYAKLGISFEIVYNYNSSGEIMGNHLYIEYSDLKTAYEVDEAKKKKE